MPRSCHVGVQVPRSASFDTRGVSAKGLLTAGWKVKPQFHGQLSQTGRGSVSHGTSTSSSAGEGGSLVTHEWEGESWLPTQPPVTPPSRVRATSSYSSEGSSLGSLLAFADEGGATFSLVFV